MRFVSYFFVVVLLCSCSEQPGDILTLDSSSSSESYIVIAGQDTNHRGFAFYDINGTLIRNGNFRAENALHRGVVPFDDRSVLVSLDTTDAIYHADIDGTKTQFHGSAQFSGTIYDLVISEQGNTYVTESNRIESKSLIPMAIDCPLTISTPILELARSAILDA